MIKIISDDDGLKIIAKGSGTALFAEVADMVTSRVITVDYGIEILEQTGQREELRQAYDFEKAASAFSKQDIITVKRLLGEPVRL